jgi:hypothetical protein
MMKLTLLLTLSLAATPAKADYVTISGAVDNFLTQNVNGSNKIFTLSQLPISTTTVWINLNNSLLSGSSDYTLFGNTVTMATAPAASPAGTHNFYAEYLVYTTTGYPLVALLDHAQTFTQPQTFQSSATASAFFGDGSHLTGESPGNWTCALRSGSGVSPNGTNGTDTATCLTTEKVITGGCNWDNIFSTTSWSGAPTGQGFTCTGTTGANSTMTAYANCCK